MVKRQVKYMNEYIFDSYKNSMKDLRFSENQKEDLIHKLGEAVNEKNGGRMRAKLNIKKIVALTAACICVLGGTAFAAGKAVMVVSGNDYFSRTSDFGKLYELEEKVGINAPAVETFSNGYSFDIMEIENCQTQDEEGNAIDKYKELFINYTREGDPHIYVGMNPVLNDGHLTEKSLDATRANETRTVDGVNIYYSYDEYLFLPVSKDSNPSEEEMKREEEDDHFFISYGSDERQTSFSSNIVFEMDNVIYVMGTSDNDITSDELMEMAEEIIKSR